MILEKVALSLFNRGMKAGWDAIFKNNKNSYLKKIEKALSDTIKKFEKSYPPDNRSDKKFPFYHSQIFLDAIIRLKLFKNESTTNIRAKIQSELQANPNILKPQEDEITYFLDTFVITLQKDKEFKKIEVNHHYKEAIFDVYDAIQSLRSELRDINFDEIGLLKQEYESQVEEVFEEIDRLRFSTALKKLEKIEQKILANLQTASKTLTSRVEFVKAICHDHIDERDRARECYVKAYLLNPDNLRTLEIACWVYFKQNKSELKELIEKLEAIAPYNSYLWVIKTIAADNFIQFIKEAPQSVQDNLDYKRLLFNHIAVTDTSLYQKVKFLFNDIQFEIPDKITYENLNDVILVANVRFSRLISETLIDFVRPFEVTELSEHLYGLLEKLNEIKDHAEIGQSYNQLFLAYTWLKSELYFDQVGVEELIKASKEVKKLEKYFAVFIANSLQKRGNIESALELLNQYDNDEQTLTLKLFCQLDSEKGKGAANDYLQYIHSIDDKNIFNLCAFSETFIKRNLFLKEELFDVLDSKEFSNPHFRFLLLLLIETYAKERTLSIEEISSLKDALKSYANLNIFIAVLLYDNHHIRECIEFIIPQIAGNNKPHPGLLKTLIQSINEIKIEYQEKLPDLLKLWRVNFSLNPQFLSWEIEIYTLLKEWDKVKELSKLGLNNFEINEFFFTSYVSSLIQTSDFHVLDNKFVDILNFNFEYLDNVIFLGSILIDNNRLNQGFELLYKHAIIKTNIKARWNFYTLSVNHQKEDLFQEYNMVVPDCYAIFYVEDTIQTKYIPYNVHEHDELTKALLNRSKNETFTYLNGFSRKIVNIRIDKITTKYLHLLLDIQAEFQNPASDYPVEILNFNSGDIKSFEKELIAKFGVDNDIQEGQRKKNLEKYYGYEIPFFGISVINFNEDQITAYYTLTSDNSSEGFMVNPHKKNVDHLKSEPLTFVLDFTSGLLLYELSKSLKIKYVESFLVGQSLINAIDTLIYKTKTNTSRLSMEIRQHAVVPHFIPENYNINRLAFLTEIRNWLVENCKVEIPQEKINYTREFQRLQQYEAGMDFIIETSLLGNWDNHLLLSDDLIYSKSLHMEDRQISTDDFLTSFYPGYRNQIVPYLLKNRYVGVNINANHIYDSYIDRMQSDTSHVYEFCIRNLEVFYNINPKECNGVIVGFLKKLATTPVFNEQNIRSEAVNILTRCLNQSISIEILDDLAIKIRASFKLLPTYLDTLRQALRDSLQIISKTN